MNMNNMMKQVQSLQKKVIEMQSKLDEVEVTGTSGGDMVRITISAKGSAKGIKIDKSLLIPDEVEILEDLVIAAFNNAKQNADSAVSDQMKKLGIPPEMLGSMF